jgi:membrane protease YdiL (CAAX protease family)
MAAIIWASLSGIYLLTDYFKDPANYTFNFNPQSFIILLIISIVLIPFQASFEETLFRGYLAQGVGVLTKNRLLVIFIPSLLFGLMHSFNPEVAEYGFWIVMPQYILFGLVFGIITVLDDGIELAMGAHSANNIFLSVFLTSKASSLQTQALLTQHKINAVADLISLGIISVLFIIILSFIYNWKFGILTTKIEHQVIEEELTDPENISLIV